MSYIGNAPISGVFKKIDNISGLFNSVTTTFAIKVSNVAHSVATAQNILVVISGVLQEPGVAYSISGTNIVFLSAPAASASFFGIVLGSVGSVTTVTDGTITESKIADGSVSTLKLAASSVSTIKIVDGAVSTIKLAAGAAVGNIGFTPYNSTNPSGYSGNGANTYTGTQTGADNILSGWILRDTGITFLNRGTISTGTVTFDYTSGSCQRLQVAGALTIALSNFPLSGNLGVMQLELVNAGSATVTMPVINWIKLDGTFTTSISTYLSNIGRTALQTTGTDFVMLWSRDSGTTVYGKVL